MTRIAIAALAAVISTAASANVEGIRFAGDSAYVSYGDLNLQSQPGRNALTTRIQTAANRLCTTSAATSSHSQQGCSAIASRFRAASSRWTH